jgi:hypothetical protein
MIAQDESLQDDETLTVEDMERELGAEVARAVNFINSDFMPDWERAQKYYNGESDLPKVKGRSNVVATTVRDAVRNSRPSLLRIFLHADKIIEYVPNGPQSAPLAHQQSLYVNNLFFKCNGYKALYDAMQNAMLKKLGVVKFWWDDSEVTEYRYISNVPMTEIERINQQQNMQVVEQEETGAVFLSPDGQPIPLFNATIVIMRPGGEIKLENVPLEEFFIDDNASCVTDARVVGHRRNMRVGDLVAMGIDYDLLDGLDSYEPEDAGGTGEAFLRKGYFRQAETPSIDPMMRKVLVTEVYARFDYDNIGVPQLYKFLLGGTNYEMLDFERCQQIPFGVINIDPEPGTVFGKSIFDIMVQEQDTMTSLLRATCDNAHLSNNRRLAVHEQLVNLDDVQNNAIGAPIRVRQSGQIQEIGTQSTISSMLPLLQYLKQDAETKVGVTGAAMGIDHDALQSTTREAAVNTIQLSQGQIEVMARNIAEGLTVVFNGLLRLSMWHLDRNQVMESNGAYIPVDQAMFDPSMHMRPNVGLGTRQKEEKLAGLTGVLAQQKEIIGQFGPMNPICGLPQVLNTLEDITKLHGLNDVTRYFTPLTQETMQQIQQQLEQAAENQPLDPGNAMLQAEKLKAELRAQEKMLEFTLAERRAAIERQIQALEFAAKDDLERDRMAQQLEVAQTRHVQEIDTAKVRQEQEKPREQPYTPPTEE